MINPDFRATIAKVKMKPEEQTIKKKTVLNQHYYRIQQLEAELLASRNFAVEIDKEHTKTIEGLKKENKRLRELNCTHQIVELQNGIEISWLEEELKKRDEEIERLKELFKSCWYSGQASISDDGDVKGYWETWKLNNL